MRQLKRTVENCARCEENHKDLVFSEIVLHPIVDSDGTEWTYWAMCPTYEQPILLKISEEKNG